MLLPDLSCCTLKAKCMLSCVPWAKCIEFVNQLSNLHAFNFALNKYHWSMLVLYMAQSCIALAQEHCSCFTFMPKTNETLLQTFIYVLCQTGIRMNLQQFLMWGPSRKMQAMSSWQQVASEEK